VSRKVVVGIRENIYGVLVESLLEPSQDSILTLLFVIKSVLAVFLGFFFAAPMVSFQLIVKNIFQVTGGDFGIRRRPQSALPPLQFFRVHTHRNALFVSEGMHLTRGIAKRAKTQIFKTGIEGPRHGYETMIVGVLTTVSRFAHLTEKLKQISQSFGEAGRRAIHRDQRPDASPRFLGRQKGACIDGRHPYLYFIEARLLSHLELHAHPSFLFSGFFW